MAGLPFASQGNSSLAQAHGVLFCSEVAVAMNANAVHELLERSVRFAPFA